MLPCIFTGDWWPAQRASNAENVSIWWHHHVIGDGDYRSVHIESCLEHNHMAAIPHIAQYIERLVQERCKSSTNALELRLSCTNPLIWRMNTQDAIISHVPICEQNSNNEMEVIKCDTKSAKRKKTGLMHEVQFNSAKWNWRPHPYLNESKPAVNMCPDINKIFFKVYRVFWLKQKYQ